MTNPFTKEFSEQNINETSFLPIIEINDHNFDSNYADNLKEYDIFDKNSKLDLIKLKSYFDIKLAVRNRTHVTDIYYNINFRLCKATDFQKRGI